jgi:hypothetical protein
MTVSVHAYVFVYMYVCVCVCVVHVDFHVAGNASTHRHICVHLSYMHDTYIHI